MRYLAFKIILLLIFFISCSQKDPDIFYQKLDFKTEAVKFLHPKDELYVLPDLADQEIVLPVKLGSKKFDIIIDNLVGKLVYDKYYSKDFDSYAFFLEALSTTDFSIPVNYIDQFKYTQIIDTNFYGYVNKMDPLFTEYSNNDFNYIIEKYFTEIGENNFGFQYKLNIQDSTFNYNSIYKIMYVNKCIGGTDCYSGETYFVKISDK